MSVFKILFHNQDQSVEELNFACVEARSEGPDYEQLLKEEAEIASESCEYLEQHAFEDGVDVGRLLLAEELIENASDGFSSQAEAARWARWAVHKLGRALAKPHI